MTVTVREPLGVCTVLAPWNHSMGTMAAGMAPALAAGNTVVIKPSSLTPVSTAMMVEVMEEAGFPAGSVNMVLGSGSEGRHGMPLDPDTEFGPMVSKRHMEHVLDYIRIGVEEGTRVLVGGHRITEGEFVHGYFVEPTVLVDCTQDMRVVNEEIFEPVLTVQTFTDEAEAVRLANATGYGFAGGVFTSDMGRALRVCSAVDTNIMWANTYMDEPPAYR